jgi:hypothetical protein
MSWDASAFSLPNIYPSSEKKQTNRYVEILRCCDPCAPILLEQVLGIPLTWRARTESHRQINENSFRDSFMKIAPRL